MESQPHILFISSWYPNRNNLTHGIFNRHFVEAAAIHHKISVLHVCSEQGLKHNMELVTEQKEKVLTQYVYTKKINLSIPIVSHWLKRRRMLKAYDFGFENIKREQGLPHLIHLNVVLPAGVGAVHLHKKYSIPYVVNEGWTGYMKEDGSYKGLFVKYFTQKIIKAASCILPVSHDLMTAMQSHGLKGKYKVLPNVIQTQIFKPFSIPALGESEGPPSLSPSLSTFIHVSTFDSRQKNTLGILHAFKKALEKAPKLNLILVGGEKYKSELLNYVQQNALEHKVHFKSKMNAEELAVLFNQCKALIMFSNYESFGVVIGEALASGLPVICSQAGGLANTLGPELGLKVHTNNVDQLCEAILSMAEDKVVYNKTTLRNFVTERFSEAVIAQELKTLYQEILNHK